MMMKKGHVHGKDFGEREVLRLENVCKVYNPGKSNETNAVCDIDFHVYAGELTGILGPSGSGKSTLLHIMGLLDRPTQGKVYIDEIDTSLMDDAAQARIRGKKIGFIFQAFFLVPSLTAIENVELPLVIYGVPAEERQKKATSLLTRLGLGNRLNHLPGQLSGGERQRVAIARALVNDPEILLADEPTGNLDSKTGQEVLTIFDELHHEGKTVILITHDESVVRITEKVIRVRDGHVVKIEI